jgi:hypothetical protein
MLAIQALTFLANEPERLAQFLAVTGIGPDSLRKAAREPRFLAGVLDHLANDEKLLTAFAAEAKIDPLCIGDARTALSRKEGKKS